MRGCRKLGPPSVGLEGGWEVGRGQELWIVPAEPDVVGGVDTEAGDIFQEHTLFDSLFNNTYGDTSNFSYFQRLCLMCC